MKQRRDEREQFGFYKPTYGSEAAAVSVGWNPRRPHFRLLATQIT